jgi:hypothetical protein
MNQHATLTDPRTAPLCDAEGPIPTFPPRELDAQGRLKPLTPEEQRARAAAAVRTLNAIRSRPDGDPPGTEESVMRGIDANRPPGLKLFEGMV